MILSPGCKNDECAENYTSRLLHANSHTNLQGEVRADAAKPETLLKTALSAAIWVERLWPTLISFILFFNKKNYSNLSQISVIFQETVHYRKATVA